MATSSISSRFRRLSSGGGPSSWGFSSVGASSLGWEPGSIFPSLASGLRYSSNVPGG